jgi:Cu+-exporting ATPase
MVAVLVIACPVPWVLATPTAVMVGTGKAQNLEFCLKNSEALERTGKVNIVVSIRLARSRKVSQQ